MTAPEVLALCRQRGIVLTPEPDRIRLRAPAGAIDANLKSLLAEHKPAILALLTSALATPSCPSCRRVLDRGRCWWCHYRLCARCRSQNTASAFIGTCLTCQFREGNDTHHPTE
jgi:hypothetical protein